MLGRRRARPSIATGIAGRVPAEGCSEKRSSLGLSMCRWQHT